MNNNLNQFSQKNIHANVIVIKKFFVIVIKFGSFSQSSLLLMEQCLSVCLCVTVRKSKHNSISAEPIFMKFWGSIDFVVGFYLFEVRSRNSPLKSRQGAFLTLNFDHHKQYINRKPFKWAIFWYVIFACMITLSKDMDNQIFCYKGLH